MAYLRTQNTARGRKYQVVVRKAGHTLARVFWRKDEAEKWARKVEDAIASASSTKPFVRADWLHDMADASSVDDSKPHGGWTLGRALEHYGETVTPGKKGSAQEGRRIAQWRERPLAGKRLDQVTKADVQAHVRARIDEGRSGSTIRHDVMLLRALYRDAAKVWEVPDLTNPCVGVALPSPAAHRERRLEDGHGDVKGEEDRLRLALAKRNRGEELLDMLDLALETGLRRAELLGLRAGHIRTARGVTRIELADSKNSHPRKVVLSAMAAAIVQRRITGKAAMAKMFTVSEAALARMWTAAREDAGVAGFRWHDLRHEAPEPHGQQRFACGRATGAVRPSHGCRAAALRQRQGIGHCREARVGRSTTGSSAVINATIPP